MTFAANKEYTPDDIKAWTGTSCPQCSEDKLLHIVDPYYIIQRKLECPKCHFSIYFSRPSEPARAPFKFSCFRILDEYNCYYHDHLANEWLGIWSMYGEYQHMEFRDSSHIDLPKFIKKCKQLILLS